jgi:murein DD-endopeptidase MepM/ murein hydrolase activator NlpD
MSIDAAIGRIDQIIAMQRQLLDPSSAVSRGAASSPATSTASATPATGPTSFAGTLASARAADASSSPAPASASGYVNPLAGASVTPERIDQGVDYAGSGTLGAIGPGVVTQVVQTGSGWEGGGYVEYKLTAGPYAGKSVFYAEGVTPSVSVGQTLTAGQPIATIIPGAPHGIEIGWAAGRGEASYANVYGGGYTEGNPTAAGKAFSDLVASLGGPAGLTEGKPVTGTFS